MQAFLTGILIFILLLGPMGSNLAEAQDINIIDSLNQQAWELRKSTPQKALESLNQATKLAEQAHYLKGVARGGVVRAWLQYSEYDYPPALESCKQSLALYQHMGDKKGISQVFNMMGNIQLRQGQYKTALEHHKKALSIREVINDSSGIAASLNNIGLCYDEMGLNHPALKYYRRALKWELILNRKPGIARTYNNIAIILEIRGAYQEAISMHKQALEIRQQVADRAGIAASLANLGNTYDNLQNFDQALAYHFRALALFIDLSDDWSTAYVCNNIGMVYEQMGEFEEAEAYLQKGLKIHQETHDPQGIAESLLNLGVLYDSKGNLNQSLAYHQQSLSQFQALGATSEIAYANHSIAILLRKQGLIQQAKTYLQRAGEGFDQIGETEGQAYVKLEFGQLLSDSLAIKAFWEAIRLTTNNLNISLQQEELPAFDDIQMTSLVLEAVGGIGLSHLRLSQTVTKPLPDLLAAYQHFRYALTLADSMRMSFYAEETKIHLSGYTADIREGGIQTALALFEITGERTYAAQGFQWMEQNKSLALLESIQKSEVRGHLLIPDSILWREKQLIADQVYFEDILRQNLEIGNLFSEAAVRDSIFSIKAQGQKLTRHLEQEYPTYYQAKYSHANINLSEIQQQLSPDQILIESYSGRQNLFVFALTHTDFCFKVIHQPTKLEELIGDLRKLIQTPEALDRYALSFDEFQQKSAAIYHSFLAPVAHLLQGKKRVVLIPDGELYGFPFEVLIKSVIPDMYPDYRKLPYLLREYAFSYPYSAANWLQAHQRILLPHNGRFLGCFPHFNLPDSNHASKWPSLSPLNYSQEEGNALAAQWEGDILLGEAATSEQFRTRSEPYFLLHISTHGMLDSANSQEPWIAFTASPESNMPYDPLYAHELYGIHLRAQLTVLSACHTGEGKWAKGEGVLSLARAFAQAGSSSLLMSVWAVDEKSTAILIQSFYHYLAAGSSKDQALRLAKLDYLEQTDELTASPSFWAGFVLTGNSEPLQMSAGLSWPYAFSIIGFVLILLVGWRIRKPKA